MLPASTAAATSTVVTGAAATLSPVGTVDAISTADTMAMSFLTCSYIYYTAAAEYPSWFSLKLAASHCARKWDNVADI